MQLQGMFCYDIDIALDNMFGKTFAEKVNEYLSFKGLETHHIGNHTTHTHKGHTLLQFAYNYDFEMLDRLVHLPFVIKG